MAQSLEAQFATWLGQQEPDADYDYGDTCGCALHQFLTAYGYPVRGVGGSDWSDQSGIRHKLKPAMVMALVSEPHTFGALSERLATPA